MENIDFRKLPSTERYYIRKRAISLKKVGYTQVRIAEIFGVRPATVSSWNKTYKEQGLKGLTRIIHKKVCISGVNCLFLQ